MDKFKPILGRLAPMRNIQVKTKYNPWISQDTISLMKDRDNLQKDAAQTGDKNKWDQYKKIRNKINNKLKYEEKCWQRRKLEQCNGDSKSSWKTVKSILNWKSFGGPSQLFYKGQIKTKSKEIADSQNECFIKKVNDIRKNLPPQTNNPIEILKNILKNYIATFCFQPVHPN